MYQDVIIHLTNEIIENAIQQRASDIHIEPKQQQCMIRFRIDGLLSPWKTISMDESLRVIGRFKVMAGLDVSEKRLPQDGQYVANHQTLSSQIRLSTCPTIFGEKMVLRLLHDNTSPPTLDLLGMHPQQLNLLRDTLALPQGLIIMTGPTGSGKTNTIYAALNDIDTDNKNILTIENPVEIVLRHITQIGVQPYFPFSHALRTCLRQDPDTIMVGEIRDHETADIAVKAALTGHSVLTTLHTNSAKGVFARLINMNIDEYALRDALSLVIAQRLIRKLCLHCREIDEHLSEKYSRTIYSAYGCDECQDGYKGREGIFECLTDFHTFQVTHNLTLQEHAIEKLFSGITDLSELQRLGLGELH